MSATRYDASVTTAEERAAPTVRDALDALRVSDRLELTQKIGLSILLFVVTAAILWLVNGDRRADNDYFVPLANAFLHGRLGLSEAPSWLNELVPGPPGTWYVVYPPMPAVVLLPFVALFGPGLDQARISILLGALNVPLAWWVIQGMGVAWRRAAAFALVFGFGTIVWYSAQVGSSWHFAHVVAIGATLLAIRLAQLDASPSAIGLAFSVALLSRLPTALGVVFFGAYLVDRALRERDGRAGVFGALRAPAARVGLRGLPWGRIARLGASFAVGAAIPLAFYAVYNALRFGSPTEAGYALIPGLLDEYQYRSGFFSIVNIPRILYAMFLTAPVQVEGFPWIQPPLLGGLSIALTTPAFFWAIGARRPDWFTLGAWASVLLILVPTLLHADPGGAQFGFRYAQDVYPFLLLLMIHGMRGRIRFEAGVAIAVGLVVNVWGMGATYFDWFAR